MIAEIGYVTNVHIIEEYRNKGIGTELLKKVKQWAIENKIELLFLCQVKSLLIYMNVKAFQLRMR
ncbi:GNAT family N-acetyltransferase [Clostridium sp.]|uniref:GNAT family N-acetyltransferase n=1 Tax=Clostridium sp. TaxID=1506 RepID=UPI003464BFDE